MREQEDVELRGTDPVLHPCFSRSSHQAAKARWCCSDPVFFRLLFLSPGFGSGSHVHTLARLAFPDVVGSSVPHPPYSPH